MAKRITHLLATTAVAMVMQFSHANAQSGNMYDYGYGYCDAVKVAKVWNTSVNKAKTIIGNKIRSNLTHLIDADIQNSGAFCSWNDVQISYNDAVKLSNYWGINTDRAKDKAKSLVNDWGKKRFRNWFQQAANQRLS